MKLSNSASSKIEPAFAERNANKILTPPRLQKSPDTGLFSLSESYINVPIQIENTPHTESKAHRGTTATLFRVSTIFTSNGEWPLETPFKSFLRTPESADPGRRPGKTQNSRQPNVLQRPIAQPFRLSIFDYVFCSHHM